MVLNPVGPFVCDLTIGLHWSPDCANGQCADTRIHAIDGIKYKRASRKAAALETVIETLSDTSGVGGG